jgi:hypothetical protein
MNSKKKGIKNLAPGIEVIDGGIKATGKIKGGGCICTPGGWAFGSADPCGCACGCEGPSTPADNRDANDDKST